MRRKLKSEGQFSNKPVRRFSTRAIRSALKESLTVAMPFPPKILGLVGIVWSVLHRLVDLLHRFGVDHVASSHQPFLPQAS